MRIRTFRLSFAFCLYLFSALALAQSGGDPLPSWNDGDTKRKIVDFVERVSDENSPNFVPVPERIATFDNDGTLWSEQPVYFQALYALDRIREMSADHPEWKNTEPYKSAIEGDIEGLMATGIDGVMKVMLTAHTDVTVDEFNASVSDWLASSRHPTKKMRYTQMTYQPMLELLNYLRANDFKTFIVSGGGVDFIRVFAEDAYGIPPEQVVGTTGDAKYEMRDGVPTVIKAGDVLLVDDKEGKPVGIHRHIGRRPIMAVGNSDGDQAMLEYTTIPRGDQDKSPRLGVLLHHTDAEREWAYDRGSHIGGLDTALDAAPERGWVVIDMKEDWSAVYQDMGR